jgi:hypothetical protein
MAASARFRTFGHEWGTRFACDQKRTLVLLADYLVCSREWNPAAESSGIGTPARLYDLRSTFASNALAVGITVCELARIIGTSVSMIEAHYGALAGHCACQLAREDGLYDGDRVKRTRKAAIVGFLVGFLVVEVGGYASVDHESCGDLCGLELVLYFPVAVVAGLIGGLVAAAIAQMSQRW